MIQIFFPRTTWYRLFMTDYVGILVSNRFWFPYTYTPFTANRIGKKKKQHTNYTQSHIALFSTIILFFVTLHCIIQFNFVSFTLLQFDFVRFLFDCPRMCSHYIYNWIWVFGLKNRDWFVYVTTLLYADTFVDDLKKKTNRLRMTINLCHDWRFDQNEKLRTKSTEYIAYTYTHSGEYVSI